jgi:hypothetical protein
MNGAPGWFPHRLRLPHRCYALASMLPTERHSCRSGHAAHENAVSYSLGAHNRTRHKARIITSEERALRRRFGPKGRPFWPTANEGRTTPAPAGPRGTWAAYAYCRWRRRQVVPRDPRVCPPVFAPGPGQHQPHKPQGEQHREHELHHRQAPAAASMAQWLSAVLPCQMTEFGCGGGRQIEGQPWPPGFIPCPTCTSVRHDS